MRQFVYEQAAQFSFQKSHFRSIVTMKFKSTLKLVEPNFGVSLSFPHGQILFTHFVNTIGTLRSVCSKLVFLSFHLPIKIVRLNTSRLARIKFQGPLQHHEAHYLIYVFEHVILACVYHEKRSAYRVRKRWSGSGGEKNLFIF